MKKYFIIMIASILITGCDNGQKVESDQTRGTLTKNEVPATKKWGDSSLFEKSQKIIFNNDFNSLNKNMIVVTDVSSSHLTAQSETTDPIITFPELSILQGKEYIFRINITSSVNSELQLFFFLC